MSWTGHQTGKENTAFSNPHRFIHVCCNFTNKNVASPFLQAIPLCILYQFLPESLYFVLNKIQSRKVQTLRNLLNYHPLDVPTI